MNESQYAQLEHMVREREWLKQNHPLRVLFWECTLRCNMACRHCGSDCRKVALSDDMPLERFTPVLDDIAAHTDPSRIIVFTIGGEPLLREDLIDCANAITQRGFKWGFVTNGLLLDRQMLERVVAAKVKSIAVSIDGLEDNHCWMRGHKDSFRKAVEAVRLLTYTRHVAWDVITCVNRRNYSQLPQLREFLISIGLKHWRIFTIFPAGRAAKDPQMILTSKEYRGVMDFIRQTRSEGCIDLSYSCEGFLGDYETVVRDKPFRCDAGLSVASILADGGISGCLSIRSNYRQGNIATDQFWDVWQNRFQLYRNRTWLHTGPCAHCEMLRYCDGNGLHLRDEGGQLTLCNYHRIIDRHEGCP